MTGTRLDGRLQNELVLYSPVEMGVDECLKAVMSLGNEGVAEFQQKFILALLN